MKYDNIKKHPDLIEVLDHMTTAAKAYDRNMKIASALIGTGSVLIAAGITLIEVQKQILKRK